MKKILKKLLHNSSNASSRSKDYKLIASSSLFDKDWYLKAYPDVAASGIDPVVHYLHHGGKEGRLPGPLFDNFYYLAQVTHLPEEQQAVEIPLLHFLKIGQAKGLKAFPVSKNDRPRVQLSFWQNQLSRYSLWRKRFRLRQQITSLPQLEPIKKLKLTALVITWDVGHNPLGRSYMLAEALNRAVDNVVLCGFQFPRYGDDIWQPVRRGALPVIALPGGDMAEWLDVCEHAVEKFKPDVVIACKPRMPSVELGILFKEKYNIPLIVDVDDHELSFFKNAQPFSVENIQALPEESVRKETEPFGEIWSRLTETLTRQYADEIITSNVALDREFGGTIIPHVRDELAFDSALFDKQAQRSKYAIPQNAKVVMFFGTPRAHKGVGDIAEAVGKIKDESALLVVVGEAPDKSVTAQLDQLAKGKVVYLPNQPFSAIPEIIVMADLIALPQDIDHPISKFQLPAKAIDAIGMGIPLLVSATEPLMQLVADGVAKLLPNDRLDKVIEKALQKTPSAFDLSVQRKQFLLKYSYHSAALKLKQVIEQALNNERNPLTGFNELKQLQKSLFPVNTLDAPEQDVDIVLFWKQNDTGLYGRRSDMVIQYLASREDVRKVVVFDAPISEFDIARLKDSDSLTQGRNIYVKVYEKLLGKLDTSKISYNVFAHPAGVYTLNESDDGNRVSLFEGYSKYLQAVLEKEGIESFEAVFWFYPKIPLAEQIIEFFKPQKVVVDVVDDHRAWPYVSEFEKNNLTEHYRNLLGRADMAFANCQPVVDSMQEFNPAIKLVPNGCEESPAIIEPKNHAMYEELKAFKGKVIGFVGNLEAKIDIALIEKIADEFQDALIVLVGSTHANPLVRELQKHDNIRMFGVVPYENINAIVARFDVGIVPHKKMDMTDNMNPLKVFVYLANKVPVVASEVKNLPESQAIRVCQNHEEFLNNLHSCLDKQIEQIVFDEFIEKNSWQARFSNTDLNDLISLKLIPKILHFVWFSPNGDQLPGDINVNIQKWKNLYPDFLIKVWTEEKLRKFFDPLDSRIMKAIDLCRFEAMKSDIARLAIIHHKGGVYVDLKNKPESDFLYQVIRSNEPVILEHQKTLPIPEGQITNAFLASQSKTQFTALTLEMVIENVLSKVESKGVIDVTGLNVWKKAISQLEVGSVKIIDSDIAWNNTGASKDCYWMSRVSASYNGKNSNNHWSKRQKFESLYV